MPIRESHLEAIWDIGFADNSTAWVVRRNGPSVELVRKHEFAGVDIHGFARHFDRSGVEIHWFPKDAECRTVFDGKSMVSRAQEHGLNVCVMGPLPMHILYSALDSMPARDDPVLEVKPCKHIWVLLNGKTICDRCDMEKPAGSQSS